MDLLLTTWLRGLLMISVLVCQATVPDARGDMMQAAAALVKLMLPGLVAAVGWNCVIVPKGASPTVNLTIYRDLTPATLRLIHEAIACVKPFGKVGKVGKRIKVLRLADNVVDLAVAMRCPTAPDDPPTIIFVPDLEDGLTRVRDVSIQHMTGTTAYPIGLIATFAATISEGGALHRKLEVSHFGGAWFHEGAANAWEMVSL